MELRLNIGYKQILELIYQLPKKDIEKLSAVLQTDLLTKKSKKAIQKLIINAPTWSESDFHEYQKARSHIDKSRMS